MEFRPANSVLDSREFSEAECDRDLALDLEVTLLWTRGFANKQPSHDEPTGDAASPFLDLEVQQTLANKLNKKI